MQPKRINAHTRADAPEICIAAAPTPRRGRASTDSVRENTT